MRLKSRSLFNILSPLSLVAAVLTGALSAAPARANGVTVYRVVPGGMTSGTCDTWPNGCTLPYALTQATAPGDQVWVKAGVYSPGASQGDSFNIVAGQTVYGGFAGTETLLTQRDAAAHVTILSGDIDGDDDSSNADGNFINETAADIAGTNNIRVVSMDGFTNPMTSGTVLDGFTITGGDALGVNQYGGGLLCNGYTGGVCSPTLSALVFIGNQAAYGGALMNEGLNGTSSPTLTNVTFRGNHAQGGGAVYNWGNGGVSSPSLTNVTFSGNTSNNGGAMWNDGGTGNSSPVLTNVTFGNNSAGSGGGGGMYDGHDVGGVSQASLTNVIFWGNTASSGSQMFNNALSSTPTINYSVVQFGNSGSNMGTTFSSGTGNLSTDPLLANAAAGNLRLLSVSPAIDAGNNSAPMLSGITTDLAGNARFVDDPLVADTGAGSPPIVDIGAYEYQGHLFADVPVTGKEWMEPWVERFYYNGVTTGCGVGPLIYCPDSAVTRASMAVFILRAKYGSTYVPPPATHTFTDMPVAGKEWMEAWVDQLYAEGITTGCGAGPIFCPDAPVTRGSMAVFILRALEGSSYTPPGTVHNFSDMPVVGKEWMEPWVDEFYSRGITTGCGVAPLIYCPEDSVTRGSMAVFVDRAYSLYP